MTILPQDVAIVVHLLPSICERGLHDIAAILFYLNNAGSARRGARAGDFASRRLSELFYPGFFLAY